MMPDGNEMSADAYEPYDFANRRHIGPSPEEIADRENLGAETFTGRHHRPEDPGELVGQRHRNQPRRLLRQQPNNPVAQGSFALSKALDQAAPLDAWRR